MCIALLDAATLAAAAAAAAAAASKLVRTSYRFNNLRLSQLAARSSTGVPFWSVLSLL